jgi:hypothetical protein
MVFHFQLLVTSATEQQFVQELMPHLRAVVSLPTVYWDCSSAIWGECYPNKGTARARVAFLPLTFNFPFLTVYNFCYRTAIASGIDASSPRCIQLSDRVFGLLVHDLGIVLS